MKLVMIVVLELAIAVEVRFQIHILRVKLAFAVQHGRPQALIDFFDGQALLVGEWKFATIPPVGAIAVKVIEIDHIKILGHYAPP
jgi:hypothetical protein